VSKQLGISRLVLSSMDLVMEGHFCITFVHGLPALSKQSPATQSLLMPSETKDIGETYTGPALHQDLQIDDLREPPVHFKETEIPRCKVRELEVSASSGFLLTTGNRLASNTALRRPEHLPKIFLFCPRMSVLSSFH
jgi:hypothetical protein